MRLIAFVFLLFVSNNILTAQTTPVRKPAQVLDFGQLYPTFNWGVTTDQLRADVGNTLADAIMAASNETAWPAGIATPATRKLNRAKMASYTLYYVTSLNKEIAVLLAPAAENQGMPTDMQPAKDIYFVVALGAVEWRKAD